MRSPRCRARVRLVPHTLVAALACGLALSAGCGGSEDASERAPAARPGADCDRYASPRADGPGDGSRERPYPSLRRLAGALRRGQVGCLADGRFEHRGVVRLERPGITLRPIRSGRGRVTVDGTIWVTPRATGARIARLRLTTHDPVYTIPLKIQADHVTLVASDVTSSTSISCVLIGSARVATGTVIERNRIRRCGRRGEHDHLIYVQQSRSAVIRHNLLVDNAGGWAVHLYPDADGTLIEHNVIDGNKGGVIFAGVDGVTSDDNVVRENVITGSSPRWNIESSWSDEEPGSGNDVYRNCLFSVGPGAPSGLALAVGFDESDNVVPTDDLYADPEDGDFRPLPDSGCGPALAATRGTPLLLKR